MGGLLISTLGTLSNRAYYLFLIIVMVWFFGVYVPLNERKKRQDGQAAAGKRPRREEKPPLRLSRPAALGLLAACAVLAAVGLILLIAAGAMSRPLPILLGALLAGAGLAGMGRAGRDLRAAPRQPVPRPPAREPVDRARLEQLESLLEAGILTPEEYRRKRTELMEGRK